MDGKDIDRQLRLLLNRVRMLGDLQQGYASDVTSYCEGQFTQCQNALNQIDAYLTAIGA